MDALISRIDRVRAEPSRRVIREFLSKCRKPYLAWSGGKDSTLMLWLTLQIKPDIEVIYFDADSCFPDGWEYMERLIKEWNLNFRILKTRPLIDVLTEHGLSPGIEYQTMKATVYEPIKSLVAEGYDGALIGIRADENRNRARAVSRYGNLFWAKGRGFWECWPLARWKTNELWWYIDHHQIPYHPAYDKTIFSPREEIRVSYWAGETYRTCGRFVWLKKYYPELFNQLAERVPEVTRFA